MLGGTPALNRATTTVEEKVSYDNLITNDSSVLLERQYANQKSDLGCYRCVAPKLRPMGDVGGG